MDKCDTKKLAIYTARLADATKRAAARVGTAANKIMAGRHSVIDEVVFCYELEMYAGVLTACAEYLERVDGMGVDPDTSALAGVTGKMYLSVPRITAVVANDRAQLGGMIDVSVELDDITANVNRIQWLLS